MIPQVVSAKQLKLRVTIVVHGLLNQEDLQANKGGLISESFSLWLNPQKICQIRITIFSLKVSKSQK